jgi:hypothetical protein
MTQQDHESLKQKMQAGDLEDSSIPPEPVLENTFAQSKPILKTLVIPFIIKQLYHLMSLADYTTMKEEKSFLN